MNNDEIRIAIAREMGWTHLTQFTNRVTDPNGDAIFFNPTQQSKLDLLPNYPLSLDACAEFEKGLTKGENGDDGEAERYATWLYSIVVGGYGLELGKVYESSLFDCISATALQRCEAFLRTKGKWADQPEGSHE